MYYIFIIHLAVRSGFRVTYTASMQKVKIKMTYSKYN